MGAKAKKKDKKKSKVKQAETADRYALYLKSVQAPDYDVKFFERIYKKEFDRSPKILREDFCGTAAVCCEWVKSNLYREAYGVDIDPEPLAWGAEHNVAPLSEEAQGRVHMMKGDVRTMKSPPAEVLAAQNFSFYCFKTRSELLEYFKAARKNLAEQGMLVLDMFGGAEVQEDDHEDITDHGKFEYVWDQEIFDPVSYHARFHIHFRFEDKSELQRAFTYDWRLWTIPEVRELLEEAGFSRSDVYWEDTDEKSGEGSGTYRKRSKGEADPAWNAYIVGVR